MTGEAVRPQVAVTGASGFTGGALARRLIADGYPTRVLARKPSALEDMANAEIVTGELTDVATLEKLVTGADTVFHIAAMYRAEGPPEEFMAVNRDATKALLDASIRAGVRRFVYCSTGGVHGHVAQTPGDENSPIKPADPYQDSKWEAEKICQEAIREGKIEVVIIRPCGIYGPGDTRMLKIFRMAQKGTFLFVGDGQPNFHPVYIDDLVEGFMLAMTTPEAKGEAFLIGGEYLPLREYVAAAARATGVPPPTRQVPYAPMHFLAWLCELVCKPLGIQPPLHRRRLTFFKHNRAFSTAKAHRILGYTPRMSLEEGFRRTVAWYYKTGLLTKRPGAPG